MIRKRRWSLCALATLLLAVAFSTAITTVTAQQTVQYVYDENGRLRAVIAPNGATTVYTYDAAGNIVSVTNRTTPLVTISGFTPASGRTGVTVTISGSGFSAIPAEDTVTFNGVAANILAATVNQITTTVPPGATTGRITVVSPNGAGVSRTDFVVRAALEITSFDPSIGTPETGVTVNGVGFDDTVQGNTVQFNGIPAMIDTASTHQIQTTVPLGATSGHISVTSGGNTAISSGDFFVPPRPYTTDDVDATGRVSLGESKSVAISGNRIGLIVFDATAGQKLSIVTNNVTFNFVMVNLYAPNGTMLSQNFVGQGNSSFNPSLPATGTYTILIDSFFNAGALTLKVAPIIDFSSPIITDGPPVVIALGTAGQAASLSFTGTAGQKVSLVISNVTFPFGNVSLVQSDGAVLAQTFLSSDPSLVDQEFLDTVTLPASGPYRILIDPFGQTGVATFKLYNVVDVASAMVVDGAPVIVTTTTPGQNATITFDGITGANLNLNLSSVSFSSTRISVFGPDGNIVLPPTALGGGGGDVAVSNLPQDGVYTILLDPGGPGVGSAALKLSSIVDITGSITVDGPPLSITTTSLGQNAQVTFNGIQDQRVFIALTNVSICGSSVSVKNPDGSNLVDPVNIYTAGGAIDIHNLPSPGTYTIFIDPQNTCKGDVTVQALSTGSVTIGGPQVTAAITTPGQTVSLPFSADAGRLVRVNTRDNSIPSGAISIVGPDNTVVFTAHVLLPGAGVYTLVVDPEGNTGAITINLNNSSGGSGD